MKKILTFIIIIAMTLSMGVPAFAATPATVAVVSPTAAVNPGNTVDVAVTIADNPGMDVMKLKFSYDTTALTLKDIELGSVMTGTFTKNLDKAVALLEAAGTTNATGNGTLVTLKFEVKSTAAAGNYTIGFLVAEAVNRDEERVALTTQAGTVSVVVPVTTYTVKFNANGGTGTMADITGVPAGAYTLPANGFTAPAGKQFKGWATNAAGAVITDTTYNVTGDVTLYAIWEDKPHTHTYSTEWSTDETNHWHECTCGDKKDVAAHKDANKDHNCDVCGKKMSDHTGGTATCKDKATCSICGQKYGDLAAHNYKTTWSTDSANHWHECSVCGNKKDEAAHTPGAAATETTPQTCTACGYVIKEATGHVHSYTEKNTDAKYLKSVATCTAKAVYYYSCSCGEKGTETFESGDVLAHSWGTVWASNGSKHWHECTVCKTKGDEADHAFEWKIDWEPTVTEVGGKHEKCKVCGYNKTKTPVIIDKLAPSIIDGRNAKWGKGDENGLIFKSDAAFSDFVEVLVDGKTITAENYEKREGSIVIQLEASYLATLAAGEHTITIRSASGDATTKFTVEAEIVSPPTGSTNVWVWIIIGVVALGAGAAVTVLVLRKRKKA